MEKGDGKVIKEKWPKKVRRREKVSEGRKKKWANLVERREKN